MTRLMLKKKSGEKGNSMKKLWLFCAIVLALAPTALFAQAPTVNQGVTLTPKQISAALTAVKNAKVKQAGNHLVAVAGAPRVALPGTTEPVIAPGLFTVSEALAGLTDPQPTPCFGCLITTDNPNTFGIALPANVFSSSQGPLQFVQTFQNIGYTGNVTLSLVILNGNQVIAVNSLSGGIYPSTWYVYYLFDTPTITGTALQAAAVITVGQINQVRALPFYITP